MNRRKFIKLTGAALALGSAPMAARALAAAQNAKPPVGGWGGITPDRDFYVTSFGSTPRVEPKQWRLKIHGLVANPAELDLAAVKKIPPIKETLTLECIGNPPNGTAIGNAVWTGPQLKPLLEQARPSSKAVYAALRGADGYATGVPLDELMREENFLPYLMNGVALPPDHGFPLRIFIPGKYGMKQPKWLTEIELVDHEFIGYWEARGWSNSAWRKVNSGFFFPRASYSVFNLFAAEAKAVAPVDMVGWALAGPSGIRRVEVSTDGGKTWNPAELTHQTSPYIWTVWKYRFAPRGAGTYQVRLRATDGDGNSQPTTDTDKLAGQSAQPRMNLMVTLS